MTSVTLCFLLLLGFQQDEIKTENLDTVSVGDRFMEAKGIFDSVKRPESEPLFKQIVEELEMLTTFTEEERFLMTESLKYLGLVTYPDGTENYFRKLIQFDPSYQVQAGDLPPKIVSAFDRLRGELVGSVVVSAQDDTTNYFLQGAKLFVDGREAGVIDGDTVFYVFTGLRQFEIRRPNYEPYAQEMEISSIEQGLIRGRLVRNAGEIILVSVPRDARVIVNGEQVGVTDSDVSEAYYPLLREMGVSRDAAGMFVLNGVEIGPLRVSFEKDCFKTRDMKWEVTELNLTQIKPEPMEPAQAYLNVKAAGKDEGLVFLGQERIGYTPIENHVVCPGDYELRVLFTDGEFIKPLSLADGDRMPVVAEPLPSIAWYGVDNIKEGTPPGDMEAWITGLKTWNVRKVDARDTTKVPVNPFPILFGPSEMTETNRTALTRRLKADLYMAARVVRKKVVIRTVEVAFWTPLSKQILIKEFDFREFDKFRKLVESLDLDPRLTSPWLGIQVAQLAEQQGCRVLEVHDKGPLAGQIQVGEQVHALNGSPLRGPAELMNIEPGKEVRLTLAGREVSVTPVDAIAEVRFNPVETAPQALLAKFEKMAKYHPDELIRKSARFNQARYQFFLGDVKDSYDIFSTMRLDMEYGIGQGTLFFYQGLCFRKLKFTSEATESFRSALQYPQATLFDAYGPKAAFWADSEMKNTNF
ncbi:MAG: S1C family serine protease [Acidobacteriota bacterium]|nr:S1C family serine protease [Acidobacteriota bacterium]